MRTVEYVVTVCLVCLAAWLIVHPIIEQVAQSMDNSANMIAEAGRK